MLKRLTLKAAVCIALLLSVMAVGCGGQKEAPFPSKGIEMVVPFAAGGAVDTTIRVICAKAEEALGQKFTIVNKPAGGAVEGMSYAARAKADGYTLLATTSSFVTNLLTKEVDFTFDSFEPIVMYSFDPMVFAVYAKSPYQSLDDVVEASKIEPLAYATPGQSNSKHIAGMIFEQKSGAQFKYVHTGGASEGVPMLAGGHVVVGCWSWGEVKPMVDAGNIRVLAVMSEKRDPRLPDVPTFAECGYDITYGAWRGIAAPKGLPESVREKLLKVFDEAVQDPEVIKQLEGAGFPVLYKNAEGFWKYVKDDYDSVKAILESIK